MNKTLYEIIRDLGGYVIVGGVLLIGTALLVPKNDSPKPVFSLPKSGIDYMDKNVRKYLGKPEYGRHNASQNIYIDRKPFGSLDAKVIRYYNENGNFKDTEEMAELFPRDYEEFGRVAEKSRILHPMIQIEEAIENK